MIVQKRGFSLLDLLMVLAVLGTIVAMAVPMYRKMDVRAKYLGTKNQLAGIQTVVVGRRTAENHTLIELTGSGCTMCDQGEYPGQDMRTATPVWNEGVARAWTVMGYDAQPRDQWGRPIVADQNELEFGPNDCRKDLLWSPGVDGIFDGGGYALGSTAYGDDIVLALPWFKQTPEHCAGG